MKLHYYKPTDETSNFGDELNKFLWEHYFPNYFDQDESVVFFGIGTILRAAKKQYPNSKIIVFGSGAHGIEQTLEPNFQVVFVRGPLSAAALNGVEYITDPAIITPEVFPFKKPIKKHDFSYMPHFSVANSSYKKTVEGLGIKYIDPTNPVLSILEDINASKTLICEAMHGAIVADAYRIPWIPVSTFESFNKFKWKDWSQSLSLSIKVNKLHRLYSTNNFKEILKRKLFVIKLRKIMNSRTYLSKNEISFEVKQKVLNEILNFKEKYSI